jgi:hypothetical protein
MIDYSRCDVCGDKLIEISREELTEGILKYIHVECKKKHYSFYWENGWTYKFLDYTLTQQYIVQPKRSDKINHYIIIKYIRIKERLIKIINNLFKLIHSFKQKL